MEALGLKKTGARLSRPFSTMVAAYVNNRCLALPVGVSIGDWKGVGQSSQDPF